MRISYKEAAYILNYKKKHTFQKLTCAHKLMYDEEHDRFLLTCNITWPMFVLLYVPALILDFFSSAWSCGIKYVTPLSRRMFGYYFFKWDGPHKRCLEVYEKHVSETASEVIRNVFLKTR